MLVKILAVAQRNYRNSWASDAGNAITPTS
jgi:hypothetical protein